MSVPVPLEELPQMVERYGANRYIVTAGADGRPRATCVSVKWHDVVFVQPGSAGLHVTCSPRLGS